MEDQYLQIVKYASTVSTMRTNRNNTKGGLIKRAKKQMEDLEQ